MHGNLPVPNRFLTSSDSLLSSDLRHLRKIEEKRIKELEELHKYLRQLRVEARSWDHTSVNGWRMTKSLQAQIAGT
eukprot:767610-Hanusia_phi.AAC.3